MTQTPNAANPATPLPITNRGAVGDGRTLNTTAIQQAVDQVAESGGGTVLVPAGRFLTGTIHLRDRVRVYLDPGAVLLGSTDPDDMPKIPSPYPCRTGDVSRRALLLASEVEDVAVEGLGTLDAQGGAWDHKVHGSHRPYLLRVLQCKRVRVRDLMLRDAGFWCQHYLLCEDVLIDGISVRSDVNKNNDGLDINSCCRVRVSNADIACKDDAIVLKSGTREPCRDITITNCTLQTRCNPIKLGTESRGGFWDIAISNIAMRDSLLAGLALEIMDGATLQRVTATNINMRNVGCPLFVRLGDLGRDETFDGPRQPIGRLRDVLISSVQATGTDVIGASIMGQVGHPVENITLRDWRVMTSGGGEAADAEREIEEQPNAYPEYNRFGRLPAYGFFCRHARNVRFSGLELGYEGAEARPAIVAEDVAGWHLADARLQAPTGGQPRLRLKDVREEA